MKTILFSTILVLSNVVLAKNFIYHWPTVGGLPINNACATATHFQSVKPIEYCTETGVVSRVACSKNGEAEYCRPLGLHQKPGAGESVQETTKCIKFESQHIKVGRVSKVKQCTDWVTDELSMRCLKYETVTTTMGRVFKVERHRETTDANVQFDGYLDYTIPDCQ